MPLPPTTNGSPAAPDPARESTGIPLLSTWRRVYALVLACFVVTVVLLLWLTRAFS